MYKKRHIYCATLLFMLVCLSATAGAYQVNNYWTSKEGWGQATTDFTTESERIYINVGTSTDPGGWITFKWYRPNGTRENDLGTNLLAHRVYSSSGLFIGFWTYMVIKGKDREPGPWRVEHWAYGYKNGIRDWYLMFTAYFTISAGIEPPTYNATGRWAYSTYKCWTDCPGEPDEPETGVVRLNQTGSSFTVTEERESYSGSISGGTYTYTTSYPYDEGTVSLTTTFTLSSDTTGSGVTTWDWTDGIDSCSGGHDFSITKYQAMGTPGVQLLLLDD